MCLPEFRKPLKQITPEEGVMETSWSEVQEAQGSHLPSEVEAV